MNFLPHASAAPSRESIHQARKRAMRSTREADADVDSSSQRERELSVESFSSASSASLAPHNAAAAGGSARHSRQRTRSSPLADDSEQDTLSSPWATVTPPSSSDFEAVEHADDSDLAASLTLQPEPPAPSQQRQMHLSLHLQQQLSSASASSTSSASATPPAPPPPTSTATPFAGAPPRAQRRRSPKSKARRSEQHQGRASVSPREKRRSNAPLFELGGPASPSSSSAPPTSSQHDDDDSYYGSSAFEDEHEDSFRGRGRTRKRRGDDDPVSSRRRVEEALRSSLATLLSFTSRQAISPALSSASLSSLVHSPFSGSPGTRSPRSPPSHSRQPSANQAQPHAARASGVPPPSSTAAAAQRQHYLYPTRQAPPTFVSSRESTMRGPSQLARHVSTYDRYGGASSSEAEMPAAGASDSDGESTQLASRRGSTAVTSPVQHFGGASPAMSRAPTIVESTYPYADSLQDEGVTEIEYSRSMPLSAISGLSSPPSRRGLGSRRGSSRGRGEGGSFTSSVAMTRQRGGEGSSSGGRRGSSPPPGPASLEERRLAKMVRRAQRPGASGAASPGQSIAAASLAALQQAATREAAASHELAKDPSATALLDLADAANTFSILSTGSTTTARASSPLAEYEDDSEDIESRRLAIDPDAEADADEDDDSFEAVYDDDVVSMSSRAETHGSGAGTGGMSHRQRTRSGDVWSAGPLSTPSSGRSYSGGAISSSMPTLELSSGEATTDESPPAASADSRRAARGARGTARGARSGDPEKHSEKRRSRKRALGETEESSEDEDGGEGLVSRWWRWMRGNVRVTLLSLAGVLVVVGFSTGYAEPLVQRLTKVVS